ncbi:MtrAB system accessory lipoprotein LpqB [Corynebacterium lubricantis]|uniref:MtrAB system accessory lipoprotein LpqB n=1 Tax=Corynebacterium lubricantis TaxID=541095 RepID=UPI00035C52E2|nr:MtrAB system accessory lipoprotein LpqB [Corynebacterium lubricantis]
MQKIHRHRALLPRSAVALLVVGSLGLASCTSLPTNTDPAAIRSFEPNDTSSDVPGPVPGREPDLLLRDFYAAGAIPRGDYEAARSFLTSNAQEVWNADNTTLIVDRIDLTTQPGATGQRRSFSVRGDVIGSLQEGGAFIPETGVYEATIELEQVNGEWRISSLPAGIILERTELRNQYQPYSLFFLNSTSEKLISDRRWIYSGGESTDTVLMSLLAAGPNDRLRPATWSGLPEGANFSGKTDGVYEFTGVGTLNPEESQRMASQVVWTLAVAGVPGPYRITFDGVSVSDNGEGLTTDDFVTMDPQASAEEVSKLYALNNGRLFTVEGTDVRPVDSELGDSGDIESVDLTADGHAAAVLTDPEDENSRIFAVGGMDHPQVEVMRAAEFSRPTFELHNNVVWVVADGNRIIRTVRSDTTGDVVTNEVDSSFLDDLDGEISVLRISDSGARVAMIIDGRLYTGIIERSATGERSVVNVVEFAHELEGTAVSVDWASDGALIVGTSSTDAPVVRVEQDGSASTTLPTGNINAPVVMVSTSPTMIYATDANALLQFPLQGQDSVNWREVPGLQGARSAAVVAK